MFRESLQKMVDRLEGGVAGILMGFDGISVDSYTREGEDSLDIQTVGMELAHAISQVRKAAEQLEVGLLGEVALRTERLVVIVHLLNEEYFVACAVRPAANFGKARYLMRLLAPQIQAEL
jgi:predicted regulator of Ras-like GTPase activity (Roadblock/LC7/MglB family)